MREIKVVINNNEETFRSNPFNVFIDGIKLKDFDKFTLEATMPVRDERGYIELDDIIKYTVNYFVPYFEESENKQ